MSFSLRARTSIGLLGVGLTTLLGLASPWIVQPAYAIGAAAALLCAAALALYALLAPPAVDSAAETAAQVPIQPAADNDLLEQLESLRRAQSDLLVAKRNSEAAMLAKDEFLATMSHEIRTPLNGVLPLLELVLSTPLSAEQHEHLRTAFQSAQEMLRIVDDILDYSKLDVGKLELESIGINLRELVDGVAQLMRRSAEAKGLRLTVSIDPNVRLAVRGDPVRLRQVLMNLVSNAIKFTERGSVTVLVSRRGETPTTHEVAFAVRDTGIGITAQASAKLFRPFAQGDASITRAFGGTGLGLVICKRLVDLMGGHIGVQSEAGKGALFWFSVPLLKVIGDLPAQHGLQDVRAMLVSTDDVFMRRLQASLSGFHMQTAAVPNPNEALAKLRASASMAAPWRYDLVVVDAAESATRAGAFARSVLAAHALEGVRILLLANPEEAPAAIVAEARVAMLPRSCSDLQLRAALEDLLDPRPAQSPADKQRDAALAHPPVAASNTAGESRRLRGRVLLVEDNTVNMQVARRLLGLHGLEVDGAGNGVEALASLHAAHYDLVLMDCQMPTMDGYTATRRWRAVERSRGAAALPIIAMTAHSMAGDREKCIASGMDDYLSKPLDRAKLEQMLARWIGAGAPSQTALLRGGPKVAANEPTATDVEADAANASTDPAGRPALDANIVREMLDVMGADFALLARVYLEETPLKISELERAALQGDAAAIIAPAHALKSSSANVGAIALAELARSIEEHLRRSPGAPVQDRIGLIRSEFRRVADELGSLIADDR